MPQATYTPLANITLGSSASSVTFSNIPNTYRDLILIVNGTVSSSQAFWCYFNNDTTATNYHRVYMLGDGSSTGSAAANNGVWIEMATTQSPVMLQVFDYSATDKHKTILSRGGSASALTIAMAGRWANTAAITSMKLQTQTGTINANTAISLYGVIA